MREMLFGRQAVRESLIAGRRHPFRLMLAESSQGLIIDEIAAAARRKRIPIVALSRQDLTRAANTDAHQGVALETSGYPYATTDEMLDAARERQEAPFLLLLDLIQDVHNLGSLIRTAESAGVHGVVVQARRAADITPATVNTSSGAVEHLLVAKVTNLVREIEHLKTADVWIAGLEGVPEAQNYTDSNLTGSLAIVVGGEGEGLRRLVRDRCDWLMSLPMRGKITSLNAAMAGSVALYEALRQRNARK